IAVVQDIQLFLANQLPVITVRSSAEHVEVVGGPHTIGCCTWSIISDLWRTTHTTLTRVIDPSLARLFNLIQRIINQQDGTREARGCGHSLLEEQQRVLRALRIQVTHITWECYFIFEVHQGVATVCLRRGLHDVAAYVAATITSDVVPNDFKASFRNR